MGIQELLQEAFDKGASDLFVVAGLPASFRINDLVVRRDEVKLFAEATETLIREIYVLAGRDMDKFLNTGDDDFSFAIPGLSRFRVNTYFQRGTMACVVRIITFTLPDYRDLNIPDAIMDIANTNKGLVLVTGPAGSGKSTTLSCIVDQINSNYEKHIITLEDPLEYLHRHKKSVISQREMSVDSINYVSALRAALRQSPDVILLGEMRDAETISVAMTAAETGHLIMSTLHTIGAANTIDRIVDVFPAEQQRQIRIQLSLVIKAVVSQQLIPTVDGKLTPAFEILNFTPAIRNMIRDNKIPQIEGTVYSSDAPDMVSMDNSLLKLVRSGKVYKDVALEFAVKPELLEKRLEALI